MALQHRLKSLIISLKHHRNEKDLLIQILFLDSLRCFIVFDITFNFLERHFWEKLEFKGSQLPYLEGHSSVAIDEKIVIFGGNFENDLSSPLWFFDVNDFSCSSIFIEGWIVVRLEAISDLLLLNGNVKYI